MNRIFLVLLLGAAISHAQNPQIPVTGTLGAGGNFPLVNSPTLVFTSDANHTMAYPEMSGSSGVLVVTSSVSLTATRQLVVPIAKGFQWFVVNATTGGQSITVGGSTGGTVTVASGAAAIVGCNGTDYLTPPSGGGGGSITGVTAGTGLSGGGTSGTVTVNLATPVSIANGGTGTASPGIVAGTNVTVTGSWPNQTVNSTGGAGLSGMTAGQVPVAATPTTATSSVAASIIIDTITCPLGAAGCTVTFPPPVNYIFYSAAVSDGGSASASSCTRYSTNQPATGAINGAASALGYLAFSAAPSSPQYCEINRIEPPYWTGSSISLKFLTAATTGNVIWDVQTVCVPDNTALTSSYSPTFSTSSPVTTTVNTTAYGATTTTVLTAVAAPGSGGCPSSPTTPTLVTYRIYRNASDTAAANADLLGVTIGSARSQ
jgi:hypothetical protein